MSYGCVTNQPGDDGDDDEDLGDNDHDDDGSDGDYDDGNCNGGGGCDCDDDNDYKHQVKRFVHSPISTAKYHETRFASTQKSSTVARFSNNVEGVGTYLITSSPSSKTTFPVFET